MFESAFTYTVCGMVIGFGLILFGVLAGRYPAKAVELLSEYYDMD